VSTASPLWFATRGAGAVTLLLLTVVVVLGIATTTRQHGRSWPRFLSARLHGNLATATLVFLGFHIVTAIADPFARLRWSDAIVPFGAAYRPVWLGLGVVAAELIGALAVTSGLRSLLGYGRWRAVHWAAYACWPLALLHGLGTGTDAREAWFQVLDSACVGTAFAAVVIWRLGHGWPRAAGLRTATALVSGFGIVALALWMMNGPLAPGWARAAGTPLDLLHGSAASGERLSAQSGGI
jgi:methionine sulfoxide reductase heme-binding subunit